MYHYDQLNRLRAARAYTGLDVNNTWNGVADAVANRYRSMYEYDANGNITGAARFDGSGNWYDYLHYKYQKNGPRLRRNRLYQLNDLADQANAYVNETGGAQDIAWTDDVPFDEEDADMNTAYNYGYDALGNLVRDDREHIDAIDWTVAGKVKRVQHATGEGPELNFAYGASGQRVMKQVGEPGTDAGAYREHYIRDAQGNIMATYRYTNITAASLELNERPIYGSSRLGSYAKTMQLYNAQAITSYPPPSNIIQRPDLRYELTDHLGNVAAVVTGRLLPSQSLAPYEADLVSAQGYEPFGSLMPGRNYSSDAYRFGFGKQEKDDEIYGATGTSYTAEFWQYDPRTARRWNLDPVPQIRISDYAAFGLNPITNVDPNGAYFFGLFGSTSDQRKAADAFAVQNSGTVHNRMLKSINVTHHVQTSFGEIPSVELRQQYFNPDGSRYHDCGGQPCIQAKVNDAWDDWGQSESFIGQVSYDLVDKAYLAAQGTPFGAAVVSPSQRRHLDDTPASQSEVESGFFETAATAMPGGRGPGMFKRLNAAQFSKQFKGNLARLSATSRGYANRAYNKAVDWLNKGKAPAMAVGKALGNASEKENNDDATEE